MLNDSNIAPVSNNESNQGGSVAVESNSTSVQSSSQPVASQTETNTVVIAPSPTANEQTQAQQSKRLYEREEVNRIARHAAEEREARVRAEFERNKQYSTPQSFQAQQQAQQNNAHNVPPSLEVTRQHIQQIAIEERMTAEADSLRNKIINAESKYSDYSTVTDVLTDLVNIKTAPVFNGLDNAADVIYEFGKHPEKIPPQLFELARDPFNVNNAIRARRALDIVSSQLKANEAAKNQPLPREPVQHDKPTTAAMDSGKVTVADLRKMKQYRA